MTADEETVPCETCGEPTPMKGTKRCNNCWEVECRLLGYVRKSDKARAEIITALESGFGDGAQGLIAQECLALMKMLLEKNRKYGNSALDPLRIFSKADPEEQIRVRLDDKLSRLRTSDPKEDEDVVLDLLGYLILLRVARRLAGEQRIDKFQSASKFRQFHHKDGMLCEDPLCLEWHGT